MKHAVAILAFIFALTLAARAQSVPASPWLISKQQLLSQSLKPLPKAQLASMIANAKTPAEHEQLADYFRTQSRILLAEANKHAGLRAEYTRNPAQGVHNLIDHCTYVIRDLKVRSQNAANLASEHTQMANEAAQKLTNNLRSGLQP